MSNDGCTVGDTGDNGGNTSVGGDNGEGGKDKCEEAKAKDDNTAKNAEATIDSIQKNPSPMSPYCRNKVGEMNKDLDTFNRYRKALPSARAASAVNKLGNGNTAIQGDCLTMIVDAKTLNDKLDLPSGTITDEMLRNDKTGFRAAMFKDEATGKYILVARDTQPNSLVDWLTNLDNGDGQDTPQYKAMRELTAKLKNNNVSFDLAGYSKGGGLAQEAGLVNPNSQVYVFNSAGIHKASLSRTPATSFEDLRNRTFSFSSDGEFLTHMNNTTGSQAQINNAIYLRDQLSGDGSKILGLVSPVKINYRNPEMEEAYLRYKRQESFYNDYYNDDEYGDDRKGTIRNDIFAPIKPTNPDPNFERDKASLLNNMDKNINKYRQLAAEGKDFTMMPPVRSGHHETVEDSRSIAARLVGRGDFDANELNSTKLIQHQMSAVLDPMEDSVKKNRKKLNAFNNKCGKLRR